MAAHATRIFGQPTPENRGPSLALSVALTMALFALAFTAMRSLPDISIGERSRVERPIAVQLPQIVLPTPTTKPEPVTDRSSSRARPTVPTSVPNTIAVPTIPLTPPLTAPITTPTTIPSIPRDTNPAGVGKPRGAGDAVQGSLRPGPTGLGVPTVPGWTKSAERVGNNEAIRDSILRVKIGQIPSMWKTHPPTGAEKAELEATQLAAAALRARTLTSGNSRDIVTLQGKGKDGVGAVGGPGIVSIPFPLFSSGPSPAQRKKNEALDAEYQARLRGLEDLALYKRDRRIADSLRLDSLRLDSLARRRPIPPGRPDAASR
jgi:hypothetical protein